MAIPSWDNRYLITPGVPITITQLEHLITGFKGAANGEFDNGGILTDSVDSFHVTRFTNSSNVDDGTQFFLLPFEVNSSSIDPVTTIHKTTGDVYSFSIYTVLPSLIRGGIADHPTSVQPNTRIAFVPRKYGPAITAQMTIEDANQYLLTNNFISSSILPITREMGIADTELFSSVYEEIQAEMVAASERDVWITTGAITYKTTTPYLFMAGTILTGTGIDVDLHTTLPPINRSEVTDLEGSSSETSVSYTLTTSTTPIYAIEHENLWYAFNRIASLANQIGTINTTVSGLVTQIATISGALSDLSREVSNHEIRIQALEAQTPSNSGNFIAL